MTLPDEQWASLTAMTDREMADEFEAKAIQPLRTARDHCHWLAVHRRRRGAGWIEHLLDGLLRMAYDYKGCLARGEL